MATDFGRIPARPRKANPVLSDMQFASLTARGGATRSLSTGRILVTGQDQAYLVGGGKDAGGKNVPTEHVSEFSPADARRHFEALRDRNVTADGRIKANSNEGSWVNHEGGIELDQAEAHTDFKPARAFARARGEKEIYDVKNDKSLPMRKSSRTKV